MNHVLRLCFLLVLSTPATAQEVVVDTSYYAPPPVRRRVLTADPDRRSEPYESDRSRQRKSRSAWLNQFSETQTWYAALEGNLRTDGSQLSNSFNGLIGNPGKTSLAAGILLAMRTETPGWSKPALPTPPFT